MGQGGALSTGLSPLWSRRQWLQGLAGGAALGLSGCTPTPPRLENLPGGFSGVALERGHALRAFWQRLGQGLALPAPAVVHRAKVVIAGGGMAGLAAARALELSGVQGVALLDTQPAMGGNSQGGSMSGLACPLGAHYLPLPGDDASEVQDWLEALGLRQRRAGRWQYDERHLCHSPQERLFWQGAWHEGLLPVDGVAPRTLEQYELLRAAWPRRWTGRPLPCRPSASGSARAGCPPPMPRWTARPCRPGWPARASMMRS